MALDLFKKKKSSREENQERQRIATIIDEAIVQRTKIHIRFDETATALKGISGLIIAMDSNTVVMELHGIATLKDNYIGQNISCFFRFIDRANKKREIFYTFFVKILKIRNTKASLQIAVNLPENLDGSQRRKSIRLKPELQKFSHLAFWKYDASGGFDISKPTIAHTHFKNSLVFLDNVSAGGMRLIIRSIIVKENDITLQKGDRFIVFFTFSDELAKLRNEYWLICKINNIRIDAINNDMTLGMEYIANGTRQAESGKIAWNKVDDNVIDDLAQRIYHWHLALYREKGIK
jgi:hypothetical protein